MAESWPDEHLSIDEFLGGQLQIRQPMNGYRAGVDPVLLAACIPAKAGDTVLELGCGVGTALLCLGRRVPGLNLNGVELQPDYAELARMNASENGLNARIENADIRHLPESVAQKQFSHVFANPPYFDRTSSVRALNLGRETALGEEIPLSDWVFTAAKRTAPKGYVTFIHRVERLPDLMAAAHACLGSLEVLPLIPRSGRAARLILMRGRKGGRANFKLHQGWVLHEGNRHPGDQENYTNATACVLRNGAELPF